MRILESDKVIQWIIPLVMGWTVLIGSVFDVGSDDDRRSKTDEKDEVFVRETFDLISKRGTDYIVTPETALLRTTYKDSETVLVLEANEAVHLLGFKGDFARVRTRTGYVGFVERRVLSGVWVHVSKAKRIVNVYDGTTLITSFGADFSGKDGDKVRRGSSRNPDDWRTPEGLFYITNKNDRSGYYKALVINYPTSRHAMAGLRRNEITEADYRNIIKSESTLSRPPMGTRLGGWIEFHGYGTGGVIDWTLGCIGLQNQDMDKLWRLSEAGTPVMITNE